MRGSLAGFRRAAVPQNRSRRAASSLRLDQGKLAWGMTPAKAATQRPAGRKALRRAACPAPNMPRTSPISTLPSPRMKPSSRPSVAISATTRLADGLSHRHRHPDVHPPDRDRQCAGRGRDDPRRQYPRRHVRPRLPDRDALRGGLRARGGRRQAGQDRRAAAPCDGRAAWPTARQPFRRGAADRQARSRWSARGPAGLSCAHRLAELGHEVVALRGQGPSSAGSTNTASPPTRPSTVSPRPRSTSSCRSAASRSSRQGARPRSRPSPSFAGNSTPSSSASGSPASTRSASPERALDGVRDAVDYIADLRQAEDSSSCRSGARSSSSAAA